MSRSKPCLTCASQCNGIFPGDETATGEASWSTKSRRGGAPSIKGSGCLSQQLKADDAYRLSMYSLIWGRVSAVGGQGNFGGQFDGSSQAGQVQESSVFRPEFEHFWGMIVATAALQYPTEGNCSGTQPKSIHASFDR